MSKKLLKLRDTPCNTTRPGPPELGVCLGELASSGRGGTLVVLTDCGSELDLSALASAIDVKSPVHVAVCRVGVPINETRAPTVFDGDLDNVSACGSAS